MGGHTLEAILEKAWKGGFTVQSNYARAHCQTVAALASMGYITTQEGPGEWGRTWRITKSGLEILHLEGHDV